MERYANLAQERGENLGGLEAAWYTPVSNLLHFPSRGPLAIDQLQLRPGAFWYQLVSVRGSVKLADNAKPFGRHGEGRTHKLTGALARHTPALAAGLETMEGGRFVALVRDLNGAVQLVGTPECPLQWQDSYASGSETQRNGYDWTLAGDALRRCRPYLGSWEVSAHGLETGVVLQPGAGGTVQLRTAGGQLLATVPAGKSIVLRSGFKLSYQIV
ncbi:hypothetical protein [Hymenobacter psychrotolerans]|uniref:Uncharacterized protein n=1 Tax=Hymenobacter psychrotolerans DSM 18569 TaxID=1121959 RepID=A0A1M7E6E7_9BACT|nr:hypothetical protein [Hymenobacter psychrotolerans]SHL87297.1 hypothetical protein SAMN02746009_03531 [Hymenobacter psychrotolerans DSM 18569]